MLVLVRTHFSESTGAGMGQGEGVLESKGGNVRKSSAGPPTECITARRESELSRGQREKEVGRRQALQSPDRRTSAIPAHPWVSSARAPWSPSFSETGSSKATSILSNSVYENAFGAQAQAGRAFTLQAC